MSQWQNHYAGFNLAPQAPPQQQQPQQAQLQAQQLLIQQQLATGAPATTTNAAAIGALNTYAQQIGQSPQPTTSLYNNATATLLAQFANTNINQLTTAIAAMQQQQQQQTQQQPPALLAQAQQQQKQQQQQQQIQQQLAAINQQGLGYQWSSGRLPPQILQQTSPIAAQQQQQQAQPSQISPLGINLNQYQQQQQQSQQQQQQHHQAPQDPRLANRKNLMNTQQNSSNSNANNASNNPQNTSQSFEVRPLMDLDTKRNMNNNQRGGPVSGSNNNNQNKSGPNNSGSSYNQNNNYNNNNQGSNRNNNNSRFNNNNNNNNNSSNNNNNDNRGNKPSRFQPSTPTSHNQQQVQPQINTPNRNLNPPRKPSPSPSVSSTTSTTQNSLINQPVGISNINKSSVPIPSSSSSATITTRPRSRSPLGSSSRRLSNSSHSTTTTTTTTTNNATNNKSSSSSSRYAIRVPKYSLDLKHNNVPGLKNRYSSLYIPSDFINCKYSWTNALPIDRSLKFNTNSKFHIMRKETQSVFMNDAVYEPDDINHAWTVRVMLLAMSDINEFYKRCCDLTDDSRRDDRLEHPNKLIQFLVGTKGKHELMGIGGPWSPSLDGPNPESNGQTLINTAIRTTLALTGIDLSQCTQWFRMLEIQYNRNEEYKTIIVPNTTQNNIESNSNTNSATTNITTTTTTTASTTTTTTTTATETSMDINDDATTESTNSSSSINSNFNVKLSLNNDNDIETTVIFMPNIWNLMPNSIEYQQYVDLYKKFIDNPDLPPTIPTATIKNSNNNKNNPSNVTELNSAVNTSPATKSSNIKQTTDSYKMDVHATTGQANKQESGQKNDLNKGHDDDEETLSSICKADDKKDIDGKKTEKNESEPTHHSKLDLKKMRVDDLREELAARNMDTKGLKAQLIARLKEALEAEKEKEDERTEEGKPVEKQEQSEETMKTEEIKSENDLMKSETTKETVVEPKSETVEVKAEKEPEIAQPTAVAPSTPPTTTSTKQGSSTESTSTSSTQPKLSKHEREKYYKLPSSPHIIVHPSNTAKNGKFDCQLFSLSTLLDYRKDDNKETTFEVSLFAECFHDMLMRDFGFIIYKSLLSLECEKLAYKSLNNLKRKQPSPSRDTEQQNDDAKRLKSTQSEDTGSQQPTPSTAQTLLSLNNSNTKIKSTKAINQMLLLAFLYFDTNRTSYIIDKDLEDLLLTTGLSLNRSKLKSLINRLSINKDSTINYRQLTDKPLRDLELFTNKNVKILLPSDTEILQNAVNIDRAQIKNDDVAVKTGNLVEYNGTFIDIDNTLKKLEKSESLSQALESKLKDTNEHLNDLKRDLRNSDRSKDKLHDEIQELKRKLKEQQRLNKDLEDRFSRSKDCVYRTRGQLNKLLDDCNDVIKRIQPKSNDTNKSSDQTNTTTATTANATHTTSSTSITTTTTPTATTSATAIITASTISENKNTPESATSLNINESNAQSEITVKNEEISGSGEDSTQKSFKDHDTSDDKMLIDTETNSTEDSAV